MAFIEKKDPVVLNIKLTSKGRELLSQGKLNFTYFAVGDSEMDYAYNAEVEANSTGFTAFDLNVFRPVDKNPNQLSFITKDISGVSTYSIYNQISVGPSSYVVENPVGSVGFFTNTGTTFITDANHVKQPDAMVQVSSVNGGITLVLEKAPTYGASGNEPAVGDLLFVKWTHGLSTTGHTIQKTNPTPNLFYRITHVSGTLGNGTVTVVVDRDLPDFSTLSLPTTLYAGAMIYYNSLNFTGSTFSTDYLATSVLAFEQNYQCDTDTFPFWNMSIIYTEEIAGAKSTNIKYSQFKDKAYGGFVSYIQNQAPVYKKLGVIHYTNTSPANTYGEGFQIDLSKGVTPILDIPTIMWHKSPSKTLGLKLKAYSDNFTPMYLTGSSKVNYGLGTPYYHLVDVNDNTIIVGKVFPELKIFVIEDQELLFAMSYKSNRSWTLPDYTISK